MDERLKFVARRLAGEPMAKLGRELGSSRKLLHQTNVVAQTRPMFFCLITRDSPDHQKRFNSVLGANEAGRN